MTPSNSSATVFLSYASLDVEAARRIAETLQTAGVEVWFDQNELVGGDTWDAKIRLQIASCDLFIPVISATTQARREGYFRLEWKLAAQRTHAMAEGTPFLLPVVIDATPNEQALVPSEFRAVQWLRLHTPATYQELVARVLALLRSRQSAPVTLSPPALPLQPSPGFALNRTLRWSLALGVTAAIALAVITWFRPATDGNASPLSSEALRSSEQAYLLVTRVHFTREDLALAENLARRASELNPQEARTWAVRAWLSAVPLIRGWDRSTERLEETQRLADRALALDPQSADGLNARAAVFHAQGSLAEAAVLARRALTLDPQNPQRHVRLSSILRAQGDREAARSVIAQGLLLEPKLSLLHYEFALTHVALSRPTTSDVDTALTHLDAALAIEPFANALLYKARLLALWRGDLVGMRAALNQMETLDLRERTEDRAVYMAMWAGLVERKPERTLEASKLSARSYLEDNAFVLTQGPGSKGFYTGFAHLLAGQEALARAEWTAATHLLEKRLAATPGDLRLSLELATLLGWLNRADEARALLANVEAQALESPLFPPKVLLAQAYTSLSDAPSALRLLAAILPRPDNANLTPTRLRIEPWWDRLRASPDFASLAAEPR